MRILACALLAAMALAGCRTDYSWRPDVPQEMRTVAVPTFRNESDVTGFGAAAARQILREFQREGTFRIATGDAAALEVQGIVKGVKDAVTGYDRRNGMRLLECECTAEVEVSVIDHRKGRVLIDNRVYRAVSRYAAGDDRANAMRDASGRLADDLARQVVDDVRNLKW